MLHRLVIDNLGGFRQVEQFYGDFSRCFEMPRVDKIQLDLSRIAFVTPEAVLALITTARLWQRERGTRVQLVSLDRQVQQYLHRVDFFSGCADYLFVDEQVDEAWSRSVSANLLEVSTISSEPDANAEAVYSVFGKVSNLMLGRVDNSRIKATCDLLSIVVENITHSQDVGHVLAQIYQTMDGYRVHIGIIDLGLGIPATLKPRYPDVGSDSMYLLHALDLGVSSRTGAGGLGLFNVNKIVRGQQGSMTIRSGRSVLQIADGQVLRRDDLVSIPGTQVFITVWGRHDLTKWEYLLPESSA